MNATKKQKPVAALMKRVRAILKCKAGTTEELAKLLMPESKIKHARPCLSRWINEQRDPGGVVIMALQEWATRKTLEIASKPELSEAYAEAFKAV